VQLLAESSAGDDGPLTTNAAPKLKPVSDTTPQLPRGEERRKTRTTADVESVPHRWRGVLATGPTDELTDATETLAEYFVDCGRVIPGITVDDVGSARSWWWPLPSSSDHPALLAICGGSDATAHAMASERLALRTDRIVRERLVDGHLQLVKPRGGRKSALEAWLLSLTDSDPHLRGKVATDQLRALVSEVESWVRSGASTLTTSGLIVRVAEPDNRSEQWTIELCGQSQDDDSLTVPIAAAINQSNQMQWLQTLGRLVRVAPELAPTLATREPQAIEVESATIVKFVAERSVPLTELGVGIQLPSWWSSRRRPALRARTASRSPSGAVASAASLGLGDVVSFTWEAALGGRRLTASDLAKLEKAAAAKQQLVKVRGQWVEFDASQLDRILEHIGETGETTAGELLRTGLGLDGIAVPDGVPVEGVVAAGWLGRLLDDAISTTVAPIATPETFVGVLRPYQERGVGWLEFLGGLGLGACLGDDMGLGKTAQMIGSLLAEPSQRPMLVVCPVSVISNWAIELERFAPHLRVMVHHGPKRFDSNDPFKVRALDHDVVLTSFSLIARDAEQLRTIVWSRLVLDEAQQIKNPNTAQAKAARSLVADRKIAMTGTPVENRLSELWSIMNFLNPGLLGTAAGFRKRFAIPIERDGNDNAAELLGKVTRPFLLRRLKTDRNIIDDLPDKIEQTDHVRLSTEQATLYRAVTEDLLERAAGQGGIDRRGAVLAGITKLKQVCNHPAHFLRDGSALPGRSGKLDRVEQLLDEIVDAGDKVLCFTQFAAWGNLLVPHLETRYGTAPLWLYGGVRRSKREAMIEAFRDPDGPAIFLLSIKAGGTGLNLTEASHVIHLDRWWNPAVEDQATDRAYRIGQRRTVLVHKLVSHGTIEERIDEMISSKRALAKRVVGTGEAWLTELSTEDLRDVVTLRDAEVKP